jgi:23S rRNA pseudouridine2457 synthase
LIIEAPAFWARGKKIQDERHGPTSWASITVNEGKFRQIRKIALVFLRLDSFVRIGNVYLNSLLAGEVVEVLDFNGN